MKLALKLLAGVLGLIVIVWLVFSWFEAGKEVRILCSSFRPGMAFEEVIRTLETGDYLRYRIEAGDRGEMLLVDSLYNLRSTSCVIELEAGEVVSATYE